MDNLDTKLDLVINEIIDIKKTKCWGIVKFEIILFRLRFVE